MFRVAICDDDSWQAEIIMSLLDKYQAVRPGMEIQLHNFSSGEDLLESVGENTYDLLLLDILMPDLSGIEVAERLRAQDNEVPLVFLTVSADYALDAFHLQASQYLLKPVRESSLFPVLDKIFSACSKQEERYLLFSAADSKVKVLFSSIVCVESIGRTLRLHLADGRTLSSKTVRVPFVTSLASLLEDGRFLHVHKSFVLNMDMVEELTANTFRMKGGTEVPIPRYKYADAKAKYLGYVEQKGSALVGFSIGYGS